MDAFYQIQNFNAWAELRIVGNPFCLFLTMIGMDQQVFGNLGVNPTVAPFPCIEEQESVYLNLPEVQNALHARTMDWSMCSG